MAVKLVIFDLDGTLLNSLEDLAVSTNFALRSFGFPEHSLDKYPLFVGNGIDKLLERVLPDTCKDNVHVQQLKSVFMAYYSAHKTDFTKPYSGIRELLNKLEEKGIDLAVASNKFHKETVELIDKIFPDNKFVAVFGQREGVEIKPNPQVVYDILKVAGCKNTESLYVGDSGVDMKTAYNSCIDSVGVLWGFRTEQELKDCGAKHIVYEPDEILSLL